MLGIDSIPLTEPNKEFGIGYLYFNIKTAFLLD